MVYVCCVAVTLEGTIIHKSGLITGGRSTHNVAKNWDEKDIQGTLPTPFLLFSLLASHQPGYRRLQDALLAQLRDLAKAKPRLSAEQAHIAEIARLEGELGVARDDLVREFVSGVAQC
jgi:structural maintenance of chromosome 1